MLIFRAQSCVRAIFQAFSNSGEESTGEDITGEESTGEESTEKESAGKESTGEDITGKVRQVTPVNLGQEEVLEEVLVFRSECGEVRVVVAEEGHTLG